MNKTMFGFLKLLKAIKTVFHTHKFSIRKEYKADEGKKIVTCLVCTKCGKSKSVVTNLYDYFSAV